MKYYLYCSVFAIALMAPSSASCQIINQDINNGDNIPTMSGGYVPNMYGGYVGSLTGGQIAGQYGGTINSISGAGVLNHQAGGFVGSVTSGGLINSKSNGVTDILNGGQINTMAGGTLNNLNAGTVGTMYGNQLVIIQNINGGNLNNMYGGVVNNFYNGNLGLMTDGTILSMFGGTINTMQYNATVLSLSGTGKINNLTEGKVQDMTGGTVLSLTNLGNIINLSSGLVQNMTGGLVTNLSNTGNIINMSDGLVQSMTGGVITTLSNTGNIINISDGIVLNMAGGIVDTLQNNGKIDNFSSGNVNTMNGGIINNVGTGANVSQINYGTITGNVSNGATFNINNNGYLILNSNTGAEVFDGAITNNGNLELNKYDFNNATFTMNNSANILVNETNLTIGNLNILDTDSSIIFNRGIATDIMKINNFNASYSTNFVFNVDYTNAIANNLTINNVVGTELNHKISVAAVIGNGTDYNTPISLINDNSQTLNFSLSTGKYVGLGARNYYLEGNAGTWSLHLAPLGLSDAAKIIGVSGNDRVIYSVYNIQNTLHKRLGDVRNFQGKEQLGSWVRTYASDTSVKTLTSTDVLSNGIEGGFDKEVSRGCDGRIIVGASLGLNNSKQSAKSFSTSDGGADSKTPYLGLYTTAIWNNGLYVDIIARYAYNNTKAHYHDGANIRRKFNINSNIGMFSTEIGYQYKASEKITLEPRAEIAYSYIQSDKFSDTAGFAGKYDATQSLLTSVGMLARYNLGTVQPYAKIAYLHELDGKTNVTYDNTKFSSDISGGRYEAGLGVNTNVNDDLDIFGEMVYQTGHNSYRSYDANLGLRYKF